MEKVRWPPTGLQSPRSRTWAYLLAGAGIFAVGLYYATSYIIDHKLYPWGPGETDPLAAFIVPHGDPVAIMIADTVRFDLRSEEGMADFANSLPSGGHLVYIRPEGNATAEPEPYTVTLFHQLRCLDVIRQGYTKVPEEPSPRLLHHCINYLRQTILCRPSLLLEPVTTPMGLVSDAGYDAVCRDWEAVYKEAERNHVAYEEWKSSHATK